MKYFIPQLLILGSVVAADYEMVHGFVIAGNNGAKD